MDRESKGFTVILILILTIASLSLMIVKPANAQSVPKPAVPEFSLQSYYPYYFQFIVTNKPFTPYKDANGNNITLSYNFRFKAHDGSHWYYYPAEILPNNTIFHSVFLASNSSSTTIKLPQGIHGLSSIPIGHQVDFQIQAMIGSYTEDVWNNTIFTGEYGEWSEIITTIIPPLPTPSVPEFPILAIIPLMIAVLSVAIIIRIRSRKETV